MGTNQRRASPMFDQCGRRVIQADGSELVSLAEPQAGESGAAQVCSVCQYRIENRLQIPGELQMTFRTSDVALCCSATRIARGALLFGFEQPYVLDRNQRLIGEGVQQLNLSIGKWPWLSFSNREGT